MEEKIVSTLSKVKDKKSNCIIGSVWPNQQVKAECRVKVVRSEKRQVEVELLRKVDLEKIISGSLELILFVPEESFLMVADIKSISNKSIILSFPKEYEFIDRRSDERFDHQVSGSIQIFNKKMSSIDISQNGFSFVVNKGLKLELLEGQMQEATINIGGNEIIVRCQITNVRKLELYEFEACPYGEFRVSCKILKLSKPHEVMLKNFLEKKKNLAV